MKKYLLSFVAFGMVLGLAVTPALAATSTVTVMDNTSTGENQPGWLFNRDPRTATEFEFNTDEAQIGQGSLYVEPIANDYASAFGSCNPPAPGIIGGCDKFIAENFINSMISETDTISYDFKIGSGGEDADKVHFYMNVYANFGSSPDDKFYDCRYDVVPTVGSTSDWSTVTFDPTQSYPVATRGGSSPSPFTCPSIPADMDGLSPNSNIRAFNINMGDTSINDQGLDGYFDNVVTMINGDTTVYDFEPSLTPNNKDQCKNDRWKTFNSPSFKNQGQCVSYVEKSPKAQGPKSMVSVLLNRL